MEIHFDNGTILAKLPPDWRNRSQLVRIFSESIYWKWDSRVNQFRAPAHRIYQFLGELKSLSLNCHQTITKNHVPIALNVPPLDLRPYQYEAYNQWQCKGRRGVIILPTGAGKTRVALHTIATLSAKTLVLVPTRILLHQWREELATRLKVTIGILGDSQRQVQEITVATYESALRSINSIGDKFSLVIVDEAHHFLNGERIEIIEMLCAPYCLSLSATFKYRTDGDPKISDLLGPVCFELSIDDLKGTILAPFQKLLVLVKLSFIERQFYENHMKIFREVLTQFRANYSGANSNELFQLLGKSSRGRLALGHLRKARTILSHCDAKIKKLEDLLNRFAQRKILIFTENSEVALILSSKLLVFPILAETSKQDRKKAIDLFIEGKISSLVTCRVLNEGFDVPSADMAIIIGSAHGEREHIQRVGRVLRSAPGKTALIYEIVCSETIEVRQWRKRNNHE